LVSDGLGALPYGQAPGDLQASDSVIVRIWSTGIDELRAAEYERFALERSLPMFRRRPGCLGALLVRGREGRAVITLWEDAAAVARLEHDPEYEATVEAILAAGFLRPPQLIEIMEVGGGWLAADRIVRDNLFESSSVGSCTPTTGDP